MQVDIAYLAKEFGVGGVKHRLLPKSNLIKAGLVHRYSPKQQCVSGRERSLCCVYYRVFISASSTTVSSWCKLRACGLQHRL